LFFEYSTLFLLASTLVLFFLSMLLDCGEGTLGQLIRRFGAAPNALAFSIDPDAHVSSSLLAPLVLTGIDLILTQLRVVFIR
jgi:hypothetical protein